MPGEILLHDPIVIMDRLESGSVQTILASLPDSHGKFGLLVADLIRHGARAYDVDEADVFKWVQREIDNPTTDLLRTGPN